VTADGKPRLASASENEDLFWALRGGGGNFGVVTSIEFRTHPVSTILGGLVVYPRSRAAEVLRFYRDFTESAPEELTAYAALIHTPEGVPAVAVIACYCGDLTEGEKVLKSLRSFSSPILDAIQPMPFPQMQTLLDGAFPDGNYNYWKSTFLRELSDDAIALFGRASEPGDIPSYRCSHRVLWGSCESGWGLRNCFCTASSPIFPYLSRAMDESGRVAAPYRLGSSFGRFDTSFLQRCVLFELPGRGGRRYDKSRVRSQLRAAEGRQEEVRS